MAGEAFFAAGFFVLAGFAAVRDVGFFGAAAGGLVGLRVARRLGLLDVVSTPKLAGLSAGAGLVDAAVDDAAAFGALLVGAVLDCAGRQ